MEPFLSNVTLTVFQFALQKGLWDSPILFFPCLSRVLSFDINPLISAHGVPVVLPKISNWASIPKRVLSRLVSCTLLRSAWISLALIAKDSAPLRLIFLRIAVFGCVAVFTKGLTFVSSHQRSDPTSHFRILAFPCSAPLIEGLWKSSKRENLACSPFASWEGSANILYPPRSENVENHNLLSLST